MTCTIAAAGTGLPVSPHHHPDWDHASQHDSRALAAIVAASAQPAPAADPDAELLALGAEVDRLEVKRRPFLAIYNDPTSEDREAWATFEAIDAEQNEVMKKIVALRPTTLAGFAVQARAYSYIHYGDLTAEAQEWSGATDVDLLWAVLSGLAQIPPAAAEGVVGAAPVTPIAQTAPEHPDAELLDYGQRCQAVQREVDDFDRTKQALPSSRWDEECDALTGREAWLMEAIGAQQARTVDGLAVKARVLATTYWCEKRDDADVIAWATHLARSGNLQEKAIGSLVRDLLRLASELAR